tara:strand:- start:2 stop:388 length:387 start_codon:yes stop_codon:yes gene_type:complete
MELQQIKLIVERHFEVNIDVKSRRRHLVDARKIYFGLCRDFTKYGLLKMAQTLHRDHATALHNIRSCKDLRKTDPEFNRIYIILYKKVSLLELNDWKPKPIIIPKIIHPLKLRYADKKSIRKIFNKRG